MLVTTTLKKKSRGGHSCTNVPQERGFWWVSAKLQLQFFNLSVGLVPADLQTAATPSTMKEGV